MIGLITRILLMFLLVFAIVWLMGKDSLLGGHIPKGCEATPNNQTGERIVKWKGKCYSKVWTGYDEDAVSVIPFAKGSNTYEEVSWEANG